MSLEDVKDEVSAYMDKILKLFKPGKKITVLVRAPGEPEQDFTMSSDIGPEIQAMIARRFPAAPEVPGSEYDKAVQALALCLDGDGWFAWCPEQGPMFFEVKPFVQEANESWNPCWRSDGVEYDISEPFTVPKPEDWRTSLRRILAGHVSLPEEGRAT